MTWGLGHPRHQRDVGYARPPRRPLCAAPPPSPAGTTPDLCGYIPAASTAAVLSGFARSRAAAAWFPQPAARRRFVADLGGIAARCWCCRCRCCCSTWQCLAQLSRRAASVRARSAAAGIGGGEWCDRALSSSSSRSKVSAHSAFLLWSQPRSQLPVYGGGGALLGSQRRFAAPPRLLRYWSRLACLVARAFSASSACRRGLPPPAGSLPHCPGLLRVSWRSAAM